MESKPKISLSLQIIRTYTYNLFVFVVACLIQLSSVVIKKKDEERGGQSMHLFKNALVGGEWIMQEKLDNSEFLKVIIITATTTIIMMIIK